MCTAVDLPPAVHRPALELTRERGQSLSAVVADRAASGLTRLDEPVVVARDPGSGFPVVRLGRRVTTQDVADTLDEE